MRHSDSDLVVGDGGVLSLRATFLELVVVGLEDADPEDLEGHEDGNENEDGSVERNASSIRASVLGEVTISSTSSTADHGDEELSTDNSGNEANNDDTEGNALPDVVP